MLTGSKLLHWCSFPKSQPTAELRHRSVWGWGWLLGAGLHLEQAHGTALSQKAWVTVAGLCPS